MRPVGREFDTLPPNGPAGRHPHRGFVVQANAAHYCMFSCTCPRGPLTSMKFVKVVCLTQKLDVALTCQRQAPPSAAGDVGKFTGADDATPEPWTRRTATGGGRMGNAQPLAAVLRG